MEASGSSAGCLASGERTNPWFQESSNRVIQAGDIVGFDTDMVGPFGYLADISRSMVCPDRRPSPEQRMLYEIAQEQVLTNIELMQARLKLPRVFRTMLAGSREVRSPPIHDDDPRRGLRGRISRPSSTRRIGTIGGTMPCSRRTWSFASRASSARSAAKEGVKLEQQVLITAAGAVPMSRSKFIDALEP